MFSSDQLISLSPDAPLADEAVCEELAKAAIDYAFDAFGLASDDVPGARQSNFLCVVEDAIIHCIDCGLQSDATVGEIQQDLKTFIDELAEIFNSTRSRSLTESDLVIH